MTYFSKESPILRPRFYSQNENIENPLAKSYYGRSKGKFKTVDLQQQLKLQLQILNTFIFKQSHSVHSVYFILPYPELVNVVLSFVDINKYMVRFLGTFNDRIPKSSTKQLPAVLR